MKPRIGITVNAKEQPEERTGGRLWLNWNYAQVVADSGGVPILVPPQADAEELAVILHGWLIPGGNDIDARHFGEVNHPEVIPIEEERYAMESKLLSVLPPDVPVFGICYGCQFLNVQRGGKLLQHLPDLLEVDEHAGGQQQAYSVSGGSKLHAILGNTSVNGKSYHHQAIGALGEGLKVVATHTDGTIEAVEAMDRPWMIGVQWHPERSFADQSSQRLFSSFINAAAQYARRREGVTTP